MRWRGGPRGLPLSNHAVAGYRIVGVDLVKRTKLASSFLTTCLCDRPRNDSSLYAVHFASKQQALVIVAE